MNTEAFDMEEKRHRTSENPKTNSSQVQTVKKMFEALATGNKQDFIELQKSNVVWDVDGNQAPSSPNEVTNTNIIPFAGNWYGTEGDFRTVGDFFEQTHESLNILDFETLDFFQDDNLVIARVNLEATVKETELPFEVDMAYVIELDDSDSEQGKIDSVRVNYHSLPVAEAFVGQTPSPEAIALEVKDSITGTPTSIDPKADPEETLQVVQNAYQQFLSGNLEEFSQTFAENGTLLIRSDPAVMPPANVWEGREGVQNFSKTAFEVFTPRVFQPSFIVNGNRVAVINNQETITNETGFPFEFNSVHFITVEDGLITDFEMVFDSYLSVSALAGEPLFLEDRPTIEPSTPELNLNPDSQRVTVEDLTPSISVLWDRAVQDAVIDASPGPTIASSAYGILHTAIFDAWAAYDQQAIATQLEDDLQRPEAEITEANKEEAMSFAAYRVLTELFPDQTEMFDELMTELGFDPNNTTTDATTAAGVGNVSASALLEFRLEDGSNQAGNDPNGTSGVPYSDISDYQPVNPPGNQVDIERWTPERVPIDAEPGEENSIQNFLTPHWGDVTPFALESGGQFRPEAPEPFLLVEGEVDLEAQTITLENTGEVLPITKDLIGNVINPEFIEQTENVVNFSANLTDEHKLIAEFWEDAGDTSFPPGTWMTFGQFVSARDDNTLDEDAQLFFALGNAVFDAGIATWEAKTFYDYTRPIRAIRELGELGLIGEFNQDLGGFAVEAWGGLGQGTQTILATDFLTYQTPGDHPSPPFAEYTSGHSAFSAAGAEILQSFTGSDEFGGSVTFDPGKSRFEIDVTPLETVTLEWDTFTEAADEAGSSRIYGGIHFEDADLNGRQLGRDVGQSVWEQTQFFIQGGEETKPRSTNIPIFGTTEDDIFDAADSNDDFFGDRNSVFAGAGNDFVDASQALIGQNLIYGGTGNDELLAGKNDRLFGRKGDDILDASIGSGNNVLHGQKGNDELFAGSRDRLFGGKGDDLLDASVGNGDNLLYGQEGNDIFFLGSSDRLIGNEGDDSFFVTDGGNNHLTGGEGKDAFWLTTGEFVTEANIITDFEVDIDVIGIAGLGVTSTEELTFTQMGDDAAIAFSEFDLAVLQNTQVSDLQTNATFVFS